MKYRVTPLNKEYKATAYSLAILQLGLLAALGFSLVSAKQFAFGYFVLLMAGTVNGHYLKERVHESNVTLDNE